jgi:hypothetical protein
MTVGELAAELVARLTADLRTRFPNAEARSFADRGPLGDGFGWSVGIVVDGESWGWVGVNLEPDNPTELSAHQAQKELADAYQSVIDNVWPDDDLAPWPLCPKHADHPLQPRLVRDVASRACRQDEAMSVALGSLCALLSKPNPAAVWPQ